MLHRKERGLVRPFVQSGGGEGRVVWEFSRCRTSAVVHCSSMVVLVRVSTKVWHARVPLKGWQDHCLYYRYVHVCASIYCNITILYLHHSTSLWHVFGIDFSKNFTPGTGFWYSLRFAKKVQCIFTLSKIGRCVRNLHTVALKRHLQRLTPTKSFVFGSLGSVSFCDEQQKIGNKWFTWLGNSMDEPLHRRMFPKNVAFFLVACIQSCCLSRCSCPKSRFHK